MSLNVEKFIEVLSLYLLRREDFEIKIEMVLRILKLKTEPHLALQDELLLLKSIERQFNKRIKKTLEL